MLMVGDPPAPCDQYRGRMLFLEKTARLRRRVVKRKPRAPEAIAVSEFARHKLAFEAEARQAAVLDSTAKRGILNCTRQWGKSTVLAVKAVHRAWTLAGSLTLVASPSERQSGEFLRKAAEFLGRLGVKRRGDGDNCSSLALPNGSRIVGLPGVEGTVRGFSAVSLLLIDEASRVSDATYKSLRQCRHSRWEDTPGRRSSRRSSEGDKEAAPAYMNPAPLSVRATAAFERSARKLSRAHPDFNGQIPRQSRSSKATPIIAPAGIR
jgi:hypothetical protein